MRERRNNQAPLDFSRFYSSPASKSEEMHQLLAEIERKCRQLKVEEERSSAENGDDPGNVTCDNDEITGEAHEKPGNEEEAEVKPEEPPLAEKWFHISDASVSEVSVERVLKCQAYLLFYERTL